MANELAFPTQTMYFNEHPIRCIVVGGVLHWVVKDICDALGIKNSRTFFGEDEKGVDSIYTLQTAGGPQKLQMITSELMFDRVLASKKRPAIEFRKWIAKDGIPTMLQSSAIQLTGANTPPQKLAAPLSNDYAELARRIRSVAECFEALEMKLVAKDAINVIGEWEEETGKHAPQALLQAVSSVSINQPLAELADRYNDEPLLSVKELCERMGIKTKTGTPHTSYLSRLLYKAGIYRDSGCGSYVTETIRVRTKRKLKSQWKYRFEPVQRRLLEEYGDFWQWPTTLMPIIGDDGEGLAYQRHAVRFTDFPDLHGYAVDLNRGSVREWSQEDYDLMIYREPKHQITALEEGVYLLTAPRKETRESMLDLLEAYLEKDDPVKYEMLCTMRKNASAAATTPCTALVPVSQNTSIQ